MFCKSWPNEQVVIVFNRARNTILVDNRMLLPKVINLLVAYGRESNDGLMD